MNLLALRNLFRDKVRLTVTLVGIVFAVVLITVQIGLFLGFAETTSGIIDHSQADVWIAAQGVKNFDAASPFSDRKLYQVLGTPGVALAEKFIVSPAAWKKPDGATETVEVVGFNPASSLGNPWNLVAGRISDLKAVGTVFIDELYREKLGVTRLGQEVEINGHRARVVGFTSGIRSFTMSPFVFTSFKNALDYGSLKACQTVYLLVKATPGIDASMLKSRLAARLAHVDVYTTGEFSRQTRSYWMFTTGAGIALIFASLMALVVGVVVVAQTIYATTLEHLREFGTLKAIGATNGYLYKLIAKQAVLSAIVGYLLGLAGSFLCAQAAERSGAAIALPWQLALGMFGVTLLMCLTAAFTSIHKVTRLEPVMVFRS